MDPTLLATKSKLAYTDLVYEYKMDFHESSAGAMTNEEELKAEQAGETKGTDGS